MIWKRVFLIKTWNFEKEDRDQRENTSQQALFTET